MTPFILLVFASILHSIWGEGIVHDSDVVYDFQSNFSTYTTDVTGTYNKLDADKKPLIQVDYRELHGSAIPGFNTDVRIAKLRCEWKQSRKDKNGTPLRRAVTEVCFKHNGK